MNAHECFREGDCSFVRRQTKQKTCRHSSATSAQWQHPLGQSTCTRPCTAFNRTHCEYILTRASGLLEYRWVGDRQGLNRVKCILSLALSPTFLHHFHCCDTSNCELGTNCQLIGQMWETTVARAYPLPTIVSALLGSSALSLSSYLSPSLCLCH